MGCNCGGRKKGQAMVWRVTCTGEKPKDYVTELEARAAVAVCKSGKGTYTRTRANTPAKAA